MNVTGKGKIKYALRDFPGFMIENQCILLVGSRRLVDSGHSAEPSDCTCGE
jgi:hypothetical protein